MDLQGECTLENLQAMLSTLPKSDPLYFLLLQLAANKSFDSFQATESISNLSQAIEYLEPVVQSIAAPLQRSLTLKTLASWHYILYENTQKPIDLNNAVDRASTAAVLADEVAPERREPFIFMLYSVLWARGTAMTSIKDLEKALELVRELRNISSQQQLLYSSEVQIREQLYQARFQIFGSLDDINSAIQSLETRLDSSPDRLELVSLLSVCLCQRGAYTQSITDLDRALQLAEEATHSENTANKALYLDRLGVILLNKFRRNGSMEDLGRAIDSADAAVEAARVHPSHIHLAAALQNLGLALFARVEETKSEEDLDRAMNCGEELVRMKAVKHPRHLKFLGDVLTMKYVMTDSLEYLNRAVESFETASDNADKNRLVDRCELLLSLGRALHKRFERTAVVGDINRSVAGLEEALRIKPANSPSRRYFQVIALAYASRYLRLRAKEDLNNAIEMEQAALNEFPKDHHERPVHLHNLSSLLLARFNRRESFVADDLGRAIQASQDAILLMTRTEEQPGYLSTLAALFQIRFEKVTKSVEDLTRAIEIYEDAISKSSPHSLVLPSLFHNLAIVITRKYYQTGNRDELDRAIADAKRAVNLMEEGHPDRGLYLNNLSQTLLIRFRLSNEPEDLHNAYSAKKEALNLVLASPYDRVKGCLSIACTVTESLKDFNKAADLIEPAIRLFTRITPRIQSRHDQEYLISEFSGLPSAAAAILLAAGRKPVEALELLELGRGLIANSQLELRSDIMELENLDSEEAKSLATEFKILQEELDSSLPVGESPQTRDIKSAIRIKSIERNELDCQFNEILTKIRRLPGLERFLLGPTESELMCLATTGFIVAFNSSPVRCDAFVIASDGIKVCPLPNLQYSELKIKTTEFTKYISNSSSLRTYYESKHGARMTLEWLWDVAVGPVLDFMGINDEPVDTGPKVCWMGIDLFSMLPLHAAGYNEIGSTKNVLDRVVSTYTTTIKGLMYAKAQLNKAESNTTRSLFISMPTTPGMPNGDLKYASKEVREAISILPPSTGHSILESPNKKKVLEELQQSDVVHFACHGVPHPTQPSKSHLRLQDWQTSPLSVAELSLLRLKIPRLAYLSVCFAAENTAEGLSDEGLNLAGACQLAGFPTVVGTMWHVNDEYSVNVAKRFYFGLVENESISIDKASEALHDAIRKVRDDTRRAPGMSKVKSDDPIVWAPYILMGI